MDAARYDIVSGLHVAMQTPIPIVAAKRGRNHEIDYDVMKEMYEVR